MYQYTAKCEAITSYACIFLLSNPFIEFQGLSAVFSTFRLQFLLHQTEKQRSRSSSRVSPLPSFTSKWISGVVKAGDGARRLAELLAPLISNAQYVDQSGHHRILPFRTSRPTHKDIFLK
jgi:hypothetical protein